MSVTVTINPSESSVDMIDEQRTHTSYSLSGYVSVSLKSSSSSSEKITLSSLKIYFEGQSEYIIEETGYSAMRLCNYSQEFIKGMPMKLSNKGHEEDGDSTWQFTFNLCLPGWLPSTSVFGCSLYGPGGVSYALHAEARAQVWRPFSPFFKKIIIKAQHVDIKIYQSIVPPECFNSLTVRSPSFYRTHELGPMDGEFIWRDLNYCKISLDIMSKLELAITAPRCVDVNSKSILVYVHGRAPGLSLEDREQLHFKGVDFNLIQEETYSRSPLYPFSDTPFSVSNVSERKPLRKSHPQRFFTGTGPRHLDEQYKNMSFSILESGMGELHKFQDSRIASQPQQVTDDHAWAIWECELKLVRLHPDMVELGERLRGIPWDIRADQIGPQFRVTHRLKVKLHYGYGSTFEDTIIVDTPIKLAHFRLNPNTKSPMPTGGVDHGALSLPPYSFLYDNEGESLINEDTLLPTYTAEDVLK